MRQDTWEELERRFARFPEMRAGAVPLSEIIAVEQRLRARLSGDHREFIQRYGAAIVGPLPVLGLRPVPMMGSDWSLEIVSERFRRQKWPGIDHLLLVSVDLGGNPIGTDAEGVVWVSDHDVGEVLRVAADFEEFIRAKCLQLNSTVG